MQATKPSEFIAGLRAENMGPDAVQSLTRMMPKEQAVEWAEQSARTAGEQAGISPEELKALDAAKAWSINPTEEARRVAAEAASTLPANSPAMWAANAAAFSTPLTAPKGAAPFPATDDLTAQMASGAVQLSGAKLSPAGLLELPLAPEPPQIMDMSNLLAVTEVPAPEIPQIAAVKLEEVTAAQRAQVTQQLSPFLDMGLTIAKLSPGWS